jgi:glycosyltransferase involved in cell wall biosynthesis
MAERIKVGLIYSYNKDWVAEAYYILNLIHALNTLEDEQKPELTILSYSNDEFETIKNTGYPYLKSKLLKKSDLEVQYTLPERFLNKVSRLLIKKNIIYREGTKKRLSENIHVLFPASVNSYFNNVKNKLFWIPDFQEHFLPQFFSEKEIESRKKHHALLAENGYPIAFSSNDAQQHFKDFYPKSSSKTFVLQFAVTHPVFKDVDYSSLTSKYTINRSYFFCPNQFWAHKNHFTVLKAIRILKERNQDVLVLFSGRETDYRNPGFFEELKKYVADNNLESSVRFLGFIDRKEQLQLMAHATAVIQPSFFEGWSTVVEDAKAMNQHVVLSDLPVHKEQLKERVTFFNPHDPNELATKLLEFKKEKTETINNYELTVACFGKQFLKIAQQLKA